MKITLQYQSQPAGSLQAAFLRGSTLADWLPELDRWGLPVAHLQAYLVPTSMADRHPAGLLVMLPPKAQPLAWAECMPCYLYGQRLVLPCDASLQPAMTEAELERSLLFPIQFLHPTLGMVGWELQERLDFGKMLAFAPAIAHHWQHAHPGNAPAPGLNDVKVPTPSMADTMQALKDGVNPKEMPDDGKPQDDSAWGRFIGGLLKGGLSMTQGLMGSMPQGQGSGGGFEALSGLAEWLAGKVDGLQGQRNSAIDKLLDMFERNIDEALRYAIPLASPYANRGMGGAGGDLSARNTSFNLGSLGGGLGGNQWDIGAQRQQMLRERYLKAAQEAIARGDYDKAAYIYAHLLHDLNGAANVLQQGKMYREAAAIYKEHLKNLPMAAECLEKGGLLLDAIDIYLQLERWEKAGDLYTTIGKRARADVQYERCVQAALDKADHLEASRLLIDKMDQDERAKGVLLQGWADTKAPEACLTRYFEINVTDAQVDAARMLHDLYREHTPAERQGSFLTVMATQLPQLPEGKPKELARDIAYEIVSAEAQQGDIQHMALLPKFLAGDSLIASDVGRYQVRKPKAAQEPIRPPQLNHNIQWQGCIGLGAQYLAHGREGSHLWMARFNFQGHVEYYHWPESLVADETVRLLGRASSISRAHIYQRGVALSTKSLPVNERFANAVEVSSPNWLEPDWAVVAGLGIDAEGWTWALVQGAGATSLKRYDPTGQLRLENYLKWPDGSLFEIAAMADWGILRTYKDGFVLQHPQGMLFIDGSQVVHAFDLGSPTIDLAVNRHGAGCVITTHDGAWWILPEKPAEALVNPQRIGKAGSQLKLVEILPGGLLVATTARQEVEVYGLHDHFRLELRADVGFEAVAILPGPHRRTFALLSGNGAVKCMEIEERFDEWL